MSELPDTNAAEARRWLAQAREELLTARRIAGEVDLPARIACFLSHLAAEKAMKSNLISHGVAFPKTHDLADLRSLTPAGAELGVSDADLQRLNPWTIEGRYPGDVPNATPSDAHACVEAAQRVVDAVASAIDNQEST